MPQSIRIAITGAGVAGASLIHALLQYPHLDVHIFESATAFKEAGAAIGVARNAQAALDLIGASAAQCLERAGAVPMLGTRLMLAQGEKSGTMIHELEGSDYGNRHTSIVYRAAFLRELLADVPQERMHTTKKLDRIDQKDDGPVVLHFADGTVHECDILIGADGIRSIVRKLVLGEDDPATLPRNSGWWAVLALKPYAEAQASIGKGPVNIENAREYGWIGDGPYLIHNLLDRGQNVQLIIGSKDVDAESSDRWHRTVSADEIRQLFHNWPPHLRKAVNELLCNQPEQPAIYLWEHPPARTYVSGPICITGDAAHATTPWQGSGAGITIEDSLILSTLLGRTKTPAEAVTALRVYDQVRRPRTQRLVESSRGTGQILTGKDEEAKLDLEKLKEKLKHRWDFILNLDMEKHRREALELLENELKDGKAE